VTSNRIEHLRRAGTHRRTAIAFLTVLVLLALPCAALRADDGTAVAKPVVPPGERPRIGLVLGGGGAKGAAHVGVLRVLDELRIPVDCIVGTSMGALVGGAYAVGRSAEDLEQAVREISWQDTIAGRGLREQVPMRRKLAGVIYSNGLSFGVRDGRLAAPSGLINSQNVDLTIQQLVGRSRAVQDFDKLPIPFRAIATDMQTGEMVILERGDLALAMRASMAVPGVFSPVELDGRVLGDGGLTRNLPVDIAKQACADVVIAVAVPNPTPTLEELRQPLTLVGRTLDVMIGANERQQLDTLGPADVKIIIDMGDIGSASFDRIADAIPVGRAAALARSADLARYSVSEQEYLAWRETATRPEREAVTLGAVNLRGLERVNPEFVQRTLGLEAGDVVDADVLSERINAVFALSDFERVAYTFSGDPARPTFDLHLTELSWGPHILRFDYGLHVSSDDKTAFTLGGDYLQSWVNDRGGEIHGSWRLGRTSGLDASFYQPLDAGHVWFVEPGVALQSSFEDLFLDGEAVSRYRFNAGWAYADVGRVFQQRAEMRAGLRYGRQGATTEIGTTDALDVPNEDYAGVTLRYTRDTRDRDVLWSSGSYARIGYYRSEESLGADRSYERIEGTTTLVLPFHRNVGYLRLSGGSSLDTDLPLYDTFTLGGPVSLPGLSIGQLRGSSYWSAQASYLQRVADVSYVFARSLYAGVRLTAADMSGRIDGVNAEPTYSAALVFTGLTRVGPVSLSLAGTTDDDWQLVLGLGRPIEERTITDSTW
jgi:NTE family protein